MSEEIWRSLAGVVENGDNYEVSNYGKVRRFSTKRLRITKEDKDGYPRVDLWLDNTCKNYQVHRLVAHAFITKVEGKHQVNHIDGTKNNNHVDNLEWVSNSENQLHAIKLGLIDGKYLKERMRELGKKYGSYAGKLRRKKVIQFDNEGNKINVFESQREAGIKTGLSNTAISMQCTKLTKSRSHDFYFRFES